MNVDSKGNSFWFDKLICLPLVIYSYFLPFLEGFYVVF